MWALFCVLALVLAACGGGGGNKSGPNEETPDTKDVEYDLNATIRIGVPSPNTIVDPPLQTNIGQNLYTWLIYDNLTQLDYNYNVKPMLATDWEFTNGGAALEMNLRDDVTFHDGTKFDAEAVKVNIERGKTLQGSTIAPQLAVITSVEVVSPTKVKFNLVPGEGAALPATFSLNPGMMVSPKAIAERGASLVTDPGTAGSGAYIPTLNEPGVRMHLERAKDYWDAENAGNAGKLEITFGSDTPARLNAVRAGQMDLAQINGPTPVIEAFALMDQGVITGDPVTQLSTQGVIINSSKGDMTKPEVRQALQHAINKEAIADGLFGGHASPSNQLYPEGFWAHDPALKDLFPYDVEKAKTLVKNAGGASVQLSAAQGSTNQAVAEALQAQLTEAGFDATVNLVPQAQIDAQFQGGSLEAQVQSVNPQADPGQTVAVYFTGGYKLAQGDPEVAAIAKKANNPATSQDERAKLYSQIWQTAAKNVWWTPIVYTEQVWARAKNVVDVSELPWIRSGFPNLRTVGATAS